MLNYLVGCAQVRNTDRGTVNLQQMHFDEPRAAHLGFDPVAKDGVSASGHDSIIDPVFLSSAGLLTGH